MPPNPRQPKRTAPDPASLEAARRCYLFAHFTEPHWRELAVSLRKETYGPGALIVGQEEPFERFFFIRSGDVKLYRLSPDGQEKVIELLGPDHTFAEAVMFGRGQRYPVNVEATTRTELLSLPPGPYLAKLRESPDLCFDLLSGMSRRLHGLLNEIDRLTLQQARERLISYLLQHAQPGVGGPEATVELPATRRLLASRLSVQPETLSRLFRSLKEAGLLREEEKQVLLPNTRALRESLRDIREK